MADMKSLGCTRAAVLKLNATNYHTWRQKAKMILTRENVWHTVFDPPPTTRSSKWTESNEQALACIGLLIEDKFLVDIRDHEDAHSAWKHLAQLYGQHNMQTRMLLNKTLFTTRYRPGTDMSEHLAEMMDISSRLRDLGHPLDEPLLCSAILCSLPQEFSTLITTIEANSDTSLSTEVIRAKITEEAHRQKLLKRERPQSTVAMSTEAESGYRYRSTKGECYYCHKRGHLRRDCRLRKMHESHEGLADTTKYPYPRSIPPPEQARTPRANYTVDDTAAEGSEPAHRAYHIITQSPRIMTIQNYSSETESAGWIIDTGASEHICKDPNLLEDFSTPDRLPVFHTADGRSDRAEGVGSCSLTLMSEDGQPHQLTLSPVYYLPQVTDNLLSIRKLDQQKYRTTFQNGRVLVSLDMNTWVLGQDKQGLYRTSNHQRERTLMCTHVMHEQLGHPNHHDLLSTIEHIPNTQCMIKAGKDESVCMACLQAKLANAPFRTREHPNTNKAFDMLHSDLCGPIRPVSLGGNAYVLTITDDFTRYSVVRLLKHKGEAAAQIQHFVEKHSTRFGRSPSRYRTDGGGEFCNTELRNYFLKKGIQHQTTVPHTPQENGLSERRNRTLFDSTRALMKSSGLPRTLWGEVLKTANYLQNLTVRKFQKVTPFEAWTGTKPTYQHLHSVGTKCIYLNTNPTRSKLEDRGLEGSLVGYGSSRHMYRIWDSKRNMVQISRRVVFLDRLCLHCPTVDDKTGQASSPLIPNEEISTCPTEHPPETPATRRSERTTLGTVPQKLTYDSQLSQTTSSPDWYRNKKLTNENHHDYINIRP